MKFIYWTSIYDGNIKYLEENVMLQEISKKHEVYLMASGAKCKKVAENLYNAHIIDCENDMAVKGGDLFEILKKRTDYDILIRTDLDAVIVDNDWLMRRVEKNIGSSHAVLGCKKIFKSRRHKGVYRGVQYVRGPCTATSKSVIDKINMITDRKAGFDLPYALSSRSAGAEFIHCKLYEKEKKYRGALPAWHWHYGGEGRFERFKGVVSYARANRKNT